VFKVRGLGGKLGDTVVSQLGVETMGQLAALSLRQIAAKFEEKTAQWLHSLGTGGELVPGRNLA
jgi:DNA polymerase eta